MTISFGTSQTISLNKMQSNYEVIFFVSARKSLQLVVGASRRHAAPRSQSSGAANVAQCHHIG